MLATAVQAAQVPELVVVAVQEEVLAALEELESAKADYKKAEEAQERYKEISSALARHSKLVDNLNQTTATWKKQADKLFNQKPIPAAEQPKAPAADPAVELKAQLEQLRSAQATAQEALGKVEQLRSAQAAAQKALDEYEASVRKKYNFSKLDEVKPWIESHRGDLGKITSDLEAATNARKTARVEFFEAVRVLSMVCPDDYTAEPAAAVEETAVLCEQFDAISKVLISRDQTEIADLAETLKQKVSHQTTIPEGLGDDLDNLLTRVNKPNPNFLALAAIFTAWHQKGLGVKVYCDETNQPTRYYTPGEDGKKLYVTM
ncbi:hypothetical protein KKF55_05680 [Patescibacteria group bacterium]|nr:hypothetical protein [Patescibacteria group bacterium]